MQDSQREKAFLERRLEKACKYVTDLWMPVNPKVLGSIKSKMAEGGKPVIDEIFTELKGDCALYLYTMRELIRMLNEDGIEIPPGSPKELMEQVGIERLKIVLDVEPSDVSRHSIYSTGSLQASRFQEIMTSASASEVLCESAQINPDLGFSLAMLRQLGFALIAWNYPGVYQQAVSMLKPGISLDEAIAQLLGYSPSLLAFRLARNWGLPPQFIATLDPSQGDSPELEMAFVTDAIAETLSTICRVSEALARANAPEIYPSAKTDWNEARMVIEERLGPAGIKNIQERFQENCMHYLDVAPSIFKGGAVLDPEIRIATAMQTRLLERNPFIPQCREFLQKPLTQIYEALEGSKPTKVQLELLIKEVIPLAGFTGGLVYTVEPVLKVLLPQLPIGKLSVRKSENVRLDAPHDMVARAYDSTGPIVQDHFGDDEGLFTAIAGVIGFSQRIGVLYLEISRLIYQQSPDKHLLHFKALCQTLNDCLKLG